MHITISKNCSSQQVKAVLKILTTNKKPLNSVDVFFGKIPNINDGLAFQKKIRNEWNKKTLQ